MAGDVTGRCLCGKVSYRCDDPIEKLVLCACRACRYTTGGQANAGAVVRTEALHLAGETSGYTAPGGSGQPMTRHFCPSCGTPVYTSLSGRPEVVVLRAGTLDDQQSLKVVARIWTSSAEPWHTVPADVPDFPQSFPGGPPK